MSDELDRYFESLRRDSEGPVLAGAATIRHTGTRRTRSHRIAGAGIACLATATAVAGVTTLTGHRGTPTARTPGTGTSSVPVTISSPPASSPPSVAPPSTTPSTTPPSTPSATPTTTAPSSPPAHACRVADLTLADHYSDGAMGTQHWVLDFTNTGSGPCTLDPQPRVWLTDPDTGRQVELQRDPQQDPPSHAKVLVQHGDMVGFNMRMATVELQNDPTAGCGQGAIYDTLRLQLADGVLTESHLQMGYSCKGSHSQGPFLGDW